MAEPTTTDFRIQILDGPDSTKSFGFGAQGEIRLRGRALPYRGIDYEGSQRVVTTWYQGNPRATQQIIGPELKPTVINGTWKDRFLGNGTSATGGIGAAAIYAAALDRVMRQGASVRVMWASFVRVGLITRFKSTLDRPQDLVWECEFTWRATDASPAPPDFMKSIVTKKATGTAKTLTQKAQQMSMLLDIVVPYRRPLPANITPANMAKLFKSALSRRVPPMANIFRTRMGTTSQRMTTESTSFAVFAQQADQGDMEPASRLGVGANLVKQIGRLALDDRDVSSTAPAMWNTAFDGFGARISYELLRREMVNSLSDYGTAALEQQEAWMRQIQPEVIAQVEAKENDDLRKYSLKYYGSSDYWQQIADYNNLDSSIPPVGTIVLIPQEDIVKQRTPGQAAS